MPCHHQWCQECCRLPSAAAPIRAAKEEACRRWHAPMPSGWHTHRARPRHQHRHADLESPCPPVIGSYPSQHGMRQHSAHMQRHRPNRTSNTSGLSKLGFRGCLAPLPPAAGTARSELAPARRAPCMYEGFGCGTDGRVSSLACSLPHHCASSTTPPSGDPKQVRAGAGRQAGLPAARRRQAPGNLVGRPVLLVPWPWPLSNTANCAESARNCSGCPGTFRCSTLYRTFFRKWPHPSPLPLSSAAVSKGIKIGIGKNGSMDATTNK